MSVPPYFSPVCWSKGAGGKEEAGAAASIVDACRFALEGPLLLGGPLLVYGRPLGCRWGAAGWETLAASGFL